MASLPSSLHLLRNPTTQPPIKPILHHRQSVTRRSTLLLIPLLSQSLLLTKPATALDFRMTVPDQTLEEAQSKIEYHARNLLKVKDLLMADSLKEAQKSLRKSSALLKQDIYTIIQAKPSNERLRLRRLYADLFNEVLRLDYAARDEDRIRVWQIYEKVVLYVDDILSRV